MAACVLQPHVARSAAARSGLRAGAALSRAPRGSGGRARSQGYAWLASRRRSGDRPPGDAGGAARAARGHAVTRPHRRNRRGCDDGCAPRFRRCLSRRRGPRHGQRLAANGRRAALGQPSGLDSSPGGTQPGAARRGIRRLRSAAGVDVRRRAGRVARHRGCGLRGNRARGVQACRLACRTGHRGAAAGVPAPGRARGAAADPHAANACGGRRRRVGGHAYAQRQLDLAAGPVG